MKKSRIIYKKIYEHMTEKWFLKQIGMSESQMKEFLTRGNLGEIAEKIENSADERHRFCARSIAEAAEPLTSKICAEAGLPRQRLQAAYNYVLGSLFPEKLAAIAAEEQAAAAAQPAAGHAGAAISNRAGAAAQPTAGAAPEGHGRVPGISGGIETAAGAACSIDGGASARASLFLLNILAAVFEYELETADFDPCLDIHFLTVEEVKAKKYNREYLRLREIAAKNFIYEFMRIGVELTPFNTLGHIAGVHYVAMHAARQLEALKVPVDLGLVSGAAAGHDIGKYGCKKSEERRIPYLHYYYTDLCFNRFNMPMIGHIAANHSTWDLELENLSVESLLLIYADFRVKSSRVPAGTEVVHFYTLDDAFQVILDKLDNVDEAKEHRYRKVYNKLKDFEDYMIDLGVDTSLPEIPAAEPPVPTPALKKDAALASSNEIAEEYKYAAIDHNIRLMNKFNSEEEFGSLLETARSEKHWKSLRTYVSILGEYSTYMTEKQKLMTLRFLFELLLHKESDIRSQAGEIIGQIIARFNEEYKKELPAGVDPPSKDVTNLSLWEETLNIILMPDHKLTEQHKKWVENSLKSVTAGLLSSCRPETRPQYMESLLKWYQKDDLSSMNKESLLLTALSIERDMCSSRQMEIILDFARKAASEGGSSAGTRMAALGASYHFDEGKDYYRELKECLGHDPDEKLSEEALSDMYLDNLKASTPWTVKVANIQLMLKSLEERVSDGQVLHVATHLGNLVKVSETVIVRQAAGAGLVSIIDMMPLEQRNEIAVELGKGLEIGDYQFSKYIPDYLGVIMLHLPPRELDELICDLEKLLEGDSGQVAGAVLHTFGIVIENYRIYRGLFADQEPEEATEERKYRLINLMVRGFANYDSTISQEAFWTFGMHIFGSDKLSPEEKYEIYCHCGKKIMTLYEGMEETELGFFYNAAVFNQIYGFISGYELEIGDFQVPEPQKAAFFPGTFDPFSLSHKAIAREIRNMGCEVYLALDEFSWSKKTQPRLQRRKILSMSVADEENMYIFPDDIPVNIANPNDLAVLKEIFRGKELFFVAGSDVIRNASCYRAEPAENSIHSFNHIIFRRESQEQGSLPADGPKSLDTGRYPITGKVINLTLEEYYEDISSTRIRENIDMNRDISNLIDPVAQNYIYENSLYLREPAYKHVLQAQEIELEPFGKRGSKAVARLEDELRARGYDMEKVYAYLDREDVSTVVLRDGLQKGRIVAAAGVSRLDSIDFLKTFGDQDIAAFIRSKAAGAVAVIGGIFFSRNSSITNLGQTILVELLSELLARDYTYVVYHPCEEAGMRRSTLRIVEKQGFVNIAPAGRRPIYAADMHSPVVVFKNVDTIIKNPLNKNPRVLKAVEEAHNRLLSKLTEIYPGELVLSYNSGIMHHKMINLITKLNGVPAVPLAEKRYGPCMVVPFGKVLDRVAVPNTVTKALHTEKYFTRDVSAFTIEESRFYSSLENQVKTIKSFNRPVILVDDLLHKGYRMNKIDPILKKTGVEVADTVVGVQTGRGRDLMTIKERTVDSAYFLPNMKCWIDETAAYPYIGGDGMKDREAPVSGSAMVAALNLVLPYAVPSFLGPISGKSVYEYSMTCLENARSILKTLEEEYQNVFERKLTVRRLGEVITEPKRPDVGEHVVFDENVAASAYVEKDIERLIRMRKIFK